MTEKRDFDAVSSDIEKIHKLRKKSKTIDITGSNHAAKGFDLLFDAIGLTGTTSMIHRILRESKERRSKNGH